MLIKIKNRNFKNFKIAAITIEITLSVALAVVVLFALLGLFSDNLSTMAANSGIHNLFNKKPSMEQADSSWGRNPTATQVNVQIVADQGLDWYLKNAQDTIDKYRDRTDLTLAQTEDLARALTILSINAGTTSEYMGIGGSHGIKITLVAFGSTSGQTKLVNSGKYINYQSVTSPDPLLGKVQTVYNSRFN